LKHLEEDVQQIPELLSLNIPNLFRHFPIRDRRPTVWQTFKSIFLIKQKERKERAVHLLLYKLRKERKGTLVQDSSDDSNVGTF